MRVCEHCSAENDNTRIFCSNCGTRLPELSEVEAAPSGEASAAPAGGAGVTAPPLPGTPGRRLKKAPKPPKQAQPHLTGFLISNLLWLLVVAAMLACLIQMAREPDKVPAVVGIDTAAANETFSTIRDLASSSKSISWTVNQKAINQFLETTIEMKPFEAGGPSALTARFQRTFVQLRSGSFTLCVDQKFLDHNFYFVLDLVPEITGTGTDAKVTGAAIGRMPIHPKLIPMVMHLFEPTITGLAQPLEILKQAKSVTITPDDATLQWPGTGHINP